MEGPAAVGEAGVVEDGDGVGEAGVAGGVDGLEVVEGAEDVVVPAGREGEAEEGGLDDFAGAVGAEEAVEEEEFAAAALGGTDNAEVAGAMEFVEAEAFEDGDGGVDGGMGGAGGAAAVPTAVGHLLLEEVAGEGMAARVVVLEVGEKREDHAGDAGFALAGPFGPDAEVDAAVGLESLVEQERAGFAGLGGGRRETEIAEQEQGVGGGGPLGRVKAAVI